MMSPPPLPPMPCTPKAFIRYMASFQHFRNYLIFLMQKAEDKRNVLLRKVRSLNLFSKKGNITLVNK